MIELLAGGGLVLAGYAVGRFTPGRRRQPKDPKPICGCEHDLSFHDIDSGECHAMVSTPSKYKEQCTCRRYTGPTPLDTIYAPPLTP
jgi:hypothetical protein